MKVVILGSKGIGLPIAEGIRKSGITDDITITRKSSPFLESEKSAFTCTYDNKQAVSVADIVIIAVQPKQLDELLVEIKEVLTSKHLLIPVVSGATTARIEELVGKIPIARAMPNTAIRVGQSMTCLAFNEEGKHHQSLVEKIFNAVGITLVIPENMFAEATVLCGSGTAIGLKFVRAFMQAGIQHGFKEDDALAIASQVIKGASMIVQDGDRHPETEIDKVTTPGGCTIIALAEMEHSGFTSALLKAIKAAIEKAKKLYS